MGTWIGLDVLTGSFYFAYRHFPKGKVTGSLGKLKWDLHTNKASDSRMIKMKSTVEAAEKNNRAIFQKESKTMNDVSGLTANPTSFLQKAYDSTEVLKMHVMI